MKPQTVIIDSEVSDDKILWDNLKRLSVERGGAWVYSIRPFAKQGAEYIQFANPSSVPDSYQDSTGGKIVYRGEVVNFTKAAQIREQNRGLSSRG